MCQTLISICVLGADSIRVWKEQPLPFFFFKVETKCFCSHQAAALISDTSLLKHLQDDFALLSLSCGFDYLCCFCTVVFVSNFYVCLDTTLLARSHTIIQNTSLLYFTPFNSQSQGSEYLPKQKDGIAVFAYRKLNSVISG